MEKKKRKVLVGMLIIAVLVLCIGLFMKNKTNTLNTTSINEESIVEELNENLIGAYIQQGEKYVKADTIPASGYEFNAEESYCKIGDVVQENITLSYDMETQTLTVSPIAEKGTKCYLYFDEQKLPANEYILASANAPTGQTTDWTGGTTYYYTGNPNNWVQFGGFWWRIIRINGDGSIRMIYQGTSANTTGTETRIGTSAFNSSYADNMYVGYMYTSGQKQGIGTSSTIKEVLDEWYSNNLTNYGQYIDGNAGFCGDRRTTSGSGIRTNQTYYQPLTRAQNSSPSLTCETLDIYTVKESSTGNKALINPIGLISVDEAMLAGLAMNKSTSGNYLNTGQTYWTMSPLFFVSTVDGAAVFEVLSSGSLIGNNVDNATNVRPVINLRADVSLTGSGTTTDPFKVVGA